MNIWLLAVLLAWLPVVAALGVLVGRSVAHADVRGRLRRRRLPAGPPAPAEPTPPTAHRPRVRAG